VVADSTAGLDGQAGFAHTARSCQRHEADMRIEQEISNLRDLSLTPDEAAGIARQVRWRMLRVIGVIITMSAGMSGRCQCCHLIAGKPQRLSEAGDGIRPWGTAGSAFQRTDCLDARLRPPSIPAVTPYKDTERFARLSAHDTFFAA
jgi:hypothetical protein